MHILLRFAIVFTGIVLVTCQVHAGVIISTLGEQDFADGETVSAASFNAASIGEPSPFNGLNGSDPRGPNFDASFTHTFATPASVNSATITFGINDHDSEVVGSQLANFSFDGNDLTAELNDLFESRGGGASEYNVYTVALPTSSLGDLLDGSSTFSLTLQGPSTGSGGDFDFNGAGLDFATLTIETDSVNAVPEPTTLAAFSMIGIVGLFPRRR